MGELEEKINQYYNYNASVTPAFPKTMLLETTNCCNHSCIFCSYSKMTRPRGFMREELAYRLLEEAYQEGVKEVGFYMLGEPLLDKNLEKYIRYAKKIGYSYTFITTNGSLLSEEKMITIIDSGLDSIKISLNGGSKEHYLFAHGVNCFDVVKDNIIRLSNYRKQNEYNFKIYISCVITKYTQNEDRKIIDLFSPYVDDIMILKCNSQESNMRDEVESTLKIDGTNNDFGEKGFCYYPFNRLNITYEGYLSLCCSDYRNFLIIEDLNHMSLKDAWNSEKFQQIRQRHIDGNLEGTLCYNCLNNADSYIKPISESYACPENQDLDERLKMIQSRIDRLLEADRGN